MVESYDYGPYGEIEIFDIGSSSISASAIGNPFTYTSRRLDEESGLYYYRARHYSAELKRFIQRDPLEYVDGPNAYAYVAANSVIRFDPQGTGWLSDLWDDATEVYDAVAEASDEVMGFFEGLYDDTVAAIDDLQLLELDDIDVAPHAPYPDECHVDWWPDGAPFTVPLLGENFNAVTIYHGSLPSDRWRGMCLRDHERGHSSQFKYYEEKWGPWYLNPLTIYEWVFDVAIPSVASSHFADDHAESDVEQQAFDLGGQLIGK